MTTDSGWYLEDGSPRIRPIINKDGTAFIPAILVSTYDLKTGESVLRPATDEELGLTPRKKSGRTRQPKPVEGPDAKDVTRERNKQQSRADHTISHRSIDRKPRQRQ